MNDLAGATGWHENTVRGHLTALWNDGYLTRVRDTESSTGRPSWLWSASNRAPESPYAALAGALAGALAASSADPGAAAYEAGRAWGRSLSAGVAFDGGRSTRTAVRATPDEHATVVSHTAGHAHRIHTTPADGRTRPTRPAADVAEAVIAVMRDQQFAPDTHPDGSITLRQCPLIEAASEHSSVVCAVHLGMVAGTIEALGAVDGGSTLEPFAAPGTCVLRLRVAA